MGKKERREEFLADLNEFGHYMHLIDEYAQQALEVLVRRTHILNGDGIKDVLTIREKAALYSDASEEIAADIKGGKR